MPGHRCAAAVAAFEQRIIKITDRVTQLVPLQIDFRKPQFLALKKQNSAAHRQKQRQIKPCDPGLAAITAKTRDGADHVMVGEGNAGPMIGVLRQRLQMGADDDRIRRQQQGEIVAGMQALVRRQVAAGAFELF